jgi:uncharacterized protein YjbI with pentapeptide repeats
MAKKSRMAKSSAPGKLAGKRVAFVGKFGYGTLSREACEGYAVAAGAKVVDPAKAVPDYVVAGEGRGGKPPGDVTRLKKKHPSIQVLDRADFFRAVLPDREELTRAIRGGRLDYEQWDAWETMFRVAGATVDLSRSDFRNRDLFGAHLEAVTLDWSDLRGASTHYTHFGRLRRVRLDGADAENVYFTDDLEDCSLRGANLRDAWLMYERPATVKRCDFRKAKLAEARARQGTFIDCGFTAADLTDAELEKSAFRRVDFTRADLSRVHAKDCKFDGAKFLRATLRRADLRGASLAGADLRHADLRDAVLSGADLTGATVDGADFAGAVLTGAKVAGLDPSKAKNYQPPAARTPGPSVTELAKAAAGSRHFVTSAEVDLGKDEHAELQLDAELSGRQRQVEAFSRYVRGDHHAVDLIDAPSFGRGLLNLADRWPNATLRLDSVQVKGSRTLRGQKLKDLALAAWAEAFGGAAPSADALHRQKAGQEAAVRALREAMLAELRGGAAGVKKWNARTERERDQIGPLHGLNLSGAKLSGVNLRKRDLTRASFRGATLRKVSFWSAVVPSADFSRADLTGCGFDHAECEGASFAGATLRNCGLEMANLRGANFTRADLTDVSLRWADLQGADFTGARLAEVNFEHAVHDVATRFPAGFQPGEDMTFDEALPPPTGPVAPAAPGSLDFDTFVQTLGRKVEPGRLANARAMLKADRFQLFAEVTGDSVVGVVKSQSDPKLVYSCRLASDGAFGCCTQNLRPCGGLGGALCKHLLVLVVGLAKAGKLDPATVDGWIDASRTRKPDADRDALSATLIRYKGAQAGEIDWRPTETVPEDFYSM